MESQFRPGRHRHTIGLTTNEGNARLVTTLPRVHAAQAEVEKLLPTMEDALRINKVLPRNATGQAIPCRAYFGPRARPRKRIKPMEPITN